MWQGKNKAITFSFDDAVLQDIRAIEILDKYGLKATFNLNSNALGGVRTHTYLGYTVNHSKVAPSDVKFIYQNHEVAGHTKDHIRLPSLEKDSSIIAQVEEDRLIEVSWTDQVDSVFNAGIKVVGNTQTEINI